MEKRPHFRENPKLAYRLCTFPYAALKAFIPIPFIPSETHFSTGFE
ncbi:MAG: hypothetical protein AAGU05_01055 [Anaerolineaceae bacterium]